MTTVPNLREVTQQALEVLEMTRHAFAAWGNSTAKIDAALADGYAALALPDEVEAGFQCEPQHAVTEDGFCEWVCPTPIGYLMQCCDCGLIHEVETRLAKYEPRPSEEFTVLEDPDTQAQWRMKRRDDLAKPAPAESKP